MPRNCSSLSCVKLFLVFIFLKDEQNKLKWFFLVCELYDKFWCYYTYTFGSFRLSLFVAYPHIRIYYIMHCCLETRFFVFFVVFVQLSWTNLLWKFNIIIFFSIWFILWYYFYSTIQYLVYSFREKSWKVCLNIDNLNSGILSIAISCEIQDDFFSSLTHSKNV